MARNATLQDIADRVGLSVATVSKALGDDPQIPERTKDRVRAMSKELGYRPRRYQRSGARRARPGRLGRVGLVLVQETPEVEHLTALTRACDDAEARITLEVTSIAADDSVSNRRRRLSEAAADVDGLLFSGMVTPDLVRHAASLKVPSVVMGNVMGDPDEPLAVGHQVAFDLDAMGRLATRTLWNAGHRRIGFLAAAAPRNLWYDRWRCGYRTALEQLCGSVDDDLVQVTGTAGDTGGTAARAWAKLQEPPTALVLPDPSLAACLLPALRAVGLEPGPDAVVVGATPTTARRYGMQDRPQLLVDVRAYVHACLGLLRAIAAGFGPPPGRCILPFECRNLPAPASRQREGTAHARGARRKRKTFA